MMWWISLLCFIPTNNALNTMIIHHGALMTCIDTEFAQKETWKDCVTSCAQNDTCVIAQANLTTPNECQLCSIQNLMHIQKRFRGNMIIALKTVSLDPITESMCTPFELGTINGHFNNTSNLTQYEYSTQLSEDGNVLNFSYSAMKSCPPQWEHFDRARGSWCIKVIRQDGTHVEASKACNEYNAALTGLETENETYHIWKTAYSLVERYPSQPKITERIWIDGVRKVTCQEKLTFNTKEGCVSFDGFDFEDKFLLEKQGYTWEQHNPDRLGPDSGPHQDCLALWITANNRTIDDEMCSKVLDDAPVKGFACGKEAG
ncbi:C-type lectin domain-containing protein [Caenorhabditis elegans]|uniref:C-type lectin domain-containing protein n=1 Tax=Caenorhabditis elegans TaxID=6239 RepID=Q18574_CAEEL|nr:C-type lectin domain-containing protein [Caenorhabditis elegans]CCD66621.2 C-type lectin domain-containing protein [Caenorhabditis elegans]|eukprot:NP_501134.2 C-type LECtin [Caenorhabditis elegans]